MDGIHVSTTNAVGSVVTVRDITSRVLVLLNNVPVAQGLFVNAFAQLDNIQINDIERIEVIRGPGSAVYGADAFAGVINIVTKTSKDINGTEIGARAGSFDTYDGWFLHGGEYGGFDVALSVSGRTTDGFDATVEADAQTAFDALFGTRASRAPGPLNVDKDLIDARAEVSRGPWTLRAGYFGQLNLGAGVGVSTALDPDGTADFELTNGPHLSRALLERPRSDRPGELCERALGPRRHRVSARGLWRRISRWRAPGSMKTGPVPS